MEGGGRKRPPSIRFFDIRSHMKAAFAEQLALIRELQQIDLNLHNLQQKLDALPSSISDAESAYLSAKNDLDAARTELSDVEKAKREDESELALSVEHLRNREAKLYAIKTNKEYQAALKEISDGKRANREREDRILQAMERIESLSQKITQLEADFADKESAFGEKRRAMEGEELSIREQMKGDSLRRPDVVAQIKKEIVRKYDFVRRRYALAVAEVVNGVCQGCSHRIPPQLHNEMLRREELKTCPSCQRLIFVAEPQPAESKETA